MAYITHQTIASSRKVPLQPCHTMPIEPFGSRTQCQHAHMVARQPLERTRPSLHRGVAGRFQCWKPCVF